MTLGSKFGSYTLIAQGLLLVLAGCCSAPDHACKSLKQFRQHPDERTTLTDVVYVRQGSLSQSSLLNEFSFCRLYGKVSYGNNDTLNFETWLPDPSNYNGRYLAVGNGGFAGDIDKAAMMAHLNMGFAVAGGDSGHLGADNYMAGVGKPGFFLPFFHDRDQTLAWIHNSIAMFTAPAKAIVSRFYDKDPEYSYYNGCSTGGGQGFALAQYHPDVFDGIIAGCPGNYYSHLMVSFLWNGQKAGENGSTSYIPQAKLNLITNAVVEKCDALDGVADKIIENPLSCAFNLTDLQCGPEDQSQSGCLNPEQVATAEAIYSGPINPRTGASIYPGYPFGSEAEWILQEGVLAANYAIPLLQNLVFNDIQNDLSTFDYDTDVDKVDEIAGPLIDQISTVLSPFQDAGGRMIVYQGWTDQYVSSRWAVDHYEAIVEANNGDAVDFMRLFMIPAGGHCGAAPHRPDVPASYNTVATMMDWVERGVPPPYLVASEPPDGTSRTRKLCTWPSTARYLGGDVDSSDSYTCG